MAFSAICISQTDGSGGEGIGRAVAERLGYRYVDDEVIEEAARLAQVDPALIAAAEHRQSLVQKLLAALGSAQSMLGSATLAAGIAVPAMQAPGAYRASRDDFRSMIRAAVVELGSEGEVVIGAHAASHALAGKPQVLRVLITAPNGTRCRRIAEARGLSREDAADFCARGDEGRAEYLRTFYEIEEELPTQYDLVINTEKLTNDEAVHLIVAAAKG